MNIKVKGGQVLSGEIFPSGNKNSAVALLPATILFDKEITLENVPDILDMDKLVAIMKKLGSKIVWDKKGKKMSIDNGKIRFEDLDSEDLGNIKGTSLLWGPLLARFGRVTFNNLPGGCTLGFRTLDPQYQAFRDLGVKVIDKNSGVSMDASEASGREIWLTEMSPTTTENILMLATGLTGTTKIVGAASEPHVQDLCNFLSSAGVKIFGIGSNIVTIEPVKYLQPVKYKISSDHMEITTFLAFAAANGGKVKIHDVQQNFIRPMEYVFSKFGINLKYEKDTVILNNSRVIIDAEERRGNLTVRAQPWPFLPVDTLPVFIPLALAAEKGQVIFHNWMYDAGLFWTSELIKMGANIIIADPHRVIVNAGQKLHGATLEAPYIIRAVVAMVITAMISGDETIILNADALYRGHPNFSENLKKLGARIEEV